MFRDALCSGGRGARRTIECALVLLHTDSAFTDGKDDPFHRSVAAMSFVVDMLVFVALLSVGAAYFGNDGFKHCKFPAAILLVLAGFANALLTVMRIFFYAAATVLQGLFNFGLLVYGSVSVLGRAPAWTGSDPGSDSYCHPVPFVAAAAWTGLLAAWTAIVFLVVLGLCLQGCLLGFRGPDEERPTHLRMVSHAGHRSARSAESRVRPFLREKTKKVVC